VRHTLARGKAINGSPQNLLIPIRVGLEWHPQDFQVFRALIFLHFSAFFYDALPHALRR
jgi:hypothetical protein